MILLYALFRIIYQSNKFHIALRYLTNNGVLILDNSEREKYKEIFLIYKDAGFKEITLSGIAPNGFYVYYTTIFYRLDNTLNI